MGRPKKGQQEKTVQVSFRMPEALAKAVDAIADKKSQLAGVPITRTQVVLLALREWLATQSKTNK